MLKNIYAPLSGGIVQERVLEVISNNLANVNTTAFKEDHVSAKAETSNPWPNYPTPLPPAAFKLDM
ncbi:MAG: flagellar basal body protein, partial [Silvanigrellaceae bacterium]|nr:flagellar basal body protein [Silvanigrellaceae bacterium]